MNDELELNQRSGVDTFRFPWPGVDGWLNEEEGETLYRYAKKSGFVVELGAYKGLSTLCLAQSGAKVMTVERDVTPELTENLHDSGVVIVEDDTVEAAYKYYRGKLAPDDEVDMLFVDADHLNAVNDVVAWESGVNRYIALHDNETGDVPDAIRWLTTQGWAVCEIVGALTVMRRGGPSPEHSGAG